MSDVGTSKNKIKKPDNPEICYMGIPIGKIRAVKSGYRSSISYDVRGINSSIQPTKIYYDEKDGSIVRETANNEKTRKKVPVAKIRDYFEKTRKNSKDNDITKE